MAVACCIAQILEQYRQSIFSYLYRLVQEEEVAEEIAMEVFLLAYRAGMAYAAAPRFRLLLFRQATHLAFRRLRQCALLPPVEETASSRPRPRNGRDDFALCTEPRRVSVSVPAQSPDYPKENAPSY